MAGASREQEVGQEWEELDMAPRDQTSYWQGMVRGRWAEANEWVPRPQG